MSRVGRLPIPIPRGVTVDVNNPAGVHVKGPKGELAWHYPADLRVVVDRDAIVVTRPDDQKVHRAQHGLTRALISNMVTGRLRRIYEDAGDLGNGLSRGADGKESRPAPGLLPSGDRRAPAGRGVRG